MRGFCLPLRRWKWLNSYNLWYQLSIQWPAYLMLEEAYLPALFTLLMMLWITHNRHPTAHLWMQIRGAFCVRVQSKIYVLLVSLQCHMWYHDILDCIKMAPNYTSFSKIQKIDTHASSGSWAIGCLLWGQIWMYVCFNFAIVTQPS